MKEVYAAARRARTERVKTRTKELLKNDRKTELNLWFFREIIREKGLSLKGMASRNGLISRQNIQWWLSTDDAYLSGVQNALLTSGIMPRPEIESEDEQKMAEGVPRPCHGILGRYAGKDCRLSFLARHLARKGLSIQEASKIAGLGQGVLYRAFKADDIKISTLVRCVKATGGKLKWNF